MKNEKIKDKLHSLYIEITSLCNLYCKYCYNDSGTKKVNILSVNDINNIISDAKNNLNLKEIVLSGGEPLLHPNIVEICEIIFSNNLNLKINTNGTKIDKELLERIKHTNPIFQITIDSHDEKVNDQYRGEGSFRAINKGLEAILKYYDIERTIIRCNLNFEFINNDESIYRYASYLSSKGIRFAYLSLITCQGRAQLCTYPNRLNDHMKIVRLRYILEKSLRDNNIEIVLPSAAVCQACPYANVEKYQFFYMLHISSIGNVYPCSGLLSDKYILENIKKESITNICFGKEMDDFIVSAGERIKKIPECDGCIFRGFCGKGCIAECEANNGFYSTDGQCSLRKDEIKKILNEQVRAI